MIYLRLQGGLGNQMFQYAMARNLAAKRRTKVTLDLSWYQTTKQDDGVGVRVYELEPFNIVAPIYQSNIVNTIWLKLMRSRMYSDAPESYVYQDRIMQAPNHSLLFGFFSNERYFKGIRPTLLEEFNLKDKPNQANQDLLKIIGETNSVSLHIRRGDYATSANHKAFHGLLEMDYYQRAIKQIGKQVKAPAFYVFSDDPAWAKINLKLNHQAVFISHNKRGIDDLNLMKHCQHHIIANSSFSWWGAWLANNPDKVVIAPKHWIQSKELDSSDAVPKDWSRL